ncbi:MAG: hypothetical protein B9S33_10060 [Pedosphaera sp. Tous-C6FEB]|nr:MAG: hypothetical protein B9S33_10060 [Pedosphaera sp. Tous-C6FEB]
MPEQARITSVEAVRAFRADLLVYLEKARGVVDEVSEEVSRTRSWLQDDRSAYWAQQIRRRTLVLEQAQAELFSARLGGAHQNLQLQQMAVRRAKLALEEAETKVKTTKHWLREYPAQVEPLARHADLLRHTLVSDMGKAVETLTQTIAALDAYAELKAPVAEPPAAPAAE